MGNLGKLALAGALVGQAAMPAMAVASEETEATKNAYAAGYKAAFTCSGIFNAGKTLDQIAAHELTGVDPQYASPMKNLPPAVVDRKAKRVSVAYGPGMAPRIAQWRPHLGCVQLPPGAGPEAAADLPRIEIDTTGLAMDTDNGLPWTTRAPVNGSSGNAKLDKAVALAFQKGNYGADQFTTAILIATPGAILAERYLDGLTPTTSQRTWSVAKSILASVIGTAVQDGILDVDAPAGLEAWSSPLDPRGKITLQNLLNMASGLDSNRRGNQTPRLYFGGGTVNDTSVRNSLDPRGKITLQNLLNMASGLDSNRRGNQTPRLYFGGGTVNDTSVRNSLEAAPGTRWKYANNDTLLAARALREAIIGRGGDRDAYLRYPFEALLYKIGMTHTKLETDWDGNFILSSQVWTTSRDLARLGLLHLNDGVWEGERLLPAGWAKYVATPAPVQPPVGRMPGYGSQWWLFNERFPEVPNDAYAAMGNRGQFLLVIPSKNLLIIRRGHDPAGGERFQLHEFAAAVLAALEE